MIFSSFLILGNLSDFDPSTGGGNLISNIDDLSPIDQLFLHRTALFLKETKEHYDTHSFRKVIDRLQSYVSNDMSSFYFEIQKDTLYLLPKNLSLKIHK